MNQMAAPLTRPVPAGSLLLAGAAGAFAIAVGLAAGDSGSGLLLPVAIAFGLVLVGVVMARPFAGLIMLAFSVFFMLSVPLGGMNRNANLFDVVLFPLVVASLFGRAWQEARVRDDLEYGPAHEALRRASWRFGRGAMLYFGVAALSLLPMALRLGGAPAFSSGLSLVRTAQGALLFPLGLLWLSDWKRIDAAFRAAFAAAFLFSLVNGIFVLGLGLQRAGIQWSVSEVTEAVSGPNEAAAGLLVLWALLSARQRVRPGRTHLLLMGLVFVMLPLTQSRSGLLAFATFLLLTVRRLRWRWLLGGGLALLVALPLVPAEYWGRLERSLMFKQGSFEVFTFLVRIYGYRVAWHVFLDNPVIGVGYLGFRFVSASYNDLRLSIGQVENFLFETLVGMGVLGLAALSFAFARLYELGRVARQATAPNTLGHELARVHAPLLTALLVANLTGATFVGMVGVGQVALWCAFLVRASHLAQDRVLPGGQ